MPPRKPKPTGSDITDYRHADRRKNIPPAGLAAQGKVAETPKTRYFYDPHLPPVLRFDPSGEADRLPELLQTARQRPLSEEEATLLAEALKNRQPWLEWSGKREQPCFEVDPLALHIHERVSAQAILRLAARQPLQRSLWGDPDLEYRQAVQFYLHDVDWANRLILGDSLTVMHSLARREDLAGKVQMIYLDPPYGIKFASNFQSQVGRRDVKDKDADLTREPEQIKAYRDTWTLGVHSYLAYLRDRLILARELLADSGSIFVQIGEENLHRVRNLLDEVFGSDNFVATITYKTSIGLGSKFIDPVSNYLLWFAKNTSSAEIKFHRLYKTLALGEGGATRYTKVELITGAERILSQDEIDKPDLIPENQLPFTDQGLTSRSGTETTRFQVFFEGSEYKPTVGGWRTNVEGMQRVIGAERVIKAGDTIRFKKFFNDFGAMAFANFWEDVGGGIQSRSDPKIYVVQTANKIIERCMLMTTDPGDLVLDPTCVRKGTRILTPLNPPEIGGRQEELPSPSSPPSTGGQGGYESVPIEELTPGQTILSHDGAPHRILRVIQKPHHGSLIGIQHSLTSQTLWLTPDHRVLAKPRPRSLGGHQDWSGVPAGHFARGREMRNNPTGIEQKLWSALRGRQSGFKFRRQHPIGPYIVDFYSRDANLVVEADGPTHFTPEAQAYDRERDAYLRAFGLDVLRFTAGEVEHNLDGVFQAIQNQCQIRTQSIEGAQWMQAGSLLPGDIVFWGSERKAVQIEHIQTIQSEEMVYDLEIEGAHSFLTEVCAVHNCGSGTTAYVAEQWGRRWITIDTSRVAIALARQRLLTAKFDYYRLSADSNQRSAKVSSPAAGFVYKSVPHITLKSIAQNQALDPLFAKWEPVLAEKLAALNAALAHVTPETRARLMGKLAEKERREGKKAISEADRRRWLLPSPAGRGAGGEGSWRAWEVPFDTDPDWPSALQDALQAYRAAWRGKMDEVNAAIAASAPQETLVDQPQTVPGVLRVSGPFTVEGVQPLEETLDLDPLEKGAPIEGAPDDLTTFSPPPAGEGPGVGAEPQNAAAYIQRMIALLRQDGVRFPDNKTLAFQRLQPLNHTVLHAEGEWGSTLPSPGRGGAGGGIDSEGVRRAAVRFGPQYGPFTAALVEEALWAASRGGYDDLVLAGFTFDAAAQAVIQDDPNPRVRCHLAHIRPDVNMGGLLKDTPSSQLFTVFGLPRVELTHLKNGQWMVEMQGVDIYDPLENTLRATGPDKIAAWFLDCDYDGMTFCLSQAFFPDSTAWEKLARALKSVVDPERFEAFSGTQSLPFEAGKHNRIAVKVIDPRGNEVMRVVRLKTLEMDGQL